MEIEVLTFSSKKEVIEKVAKFYIKELNLTKSKYKVVIITDPKLRKDGANGLCAKTSDREITVALYSRLNMLDMLLTLAHEMVHVKQHVRNEIGKKHVILKKDSLIVLTEWNGSIWKPRPGEDEYYDSPWEIEAYGKEIGLAHQFANFWNGEK